MSQTFGPPPSLPWDSSMIKVFRMHLVVGYEQVLGVTALIGRAQYHSPARDLVHLARNRSPVKSAI